MRVQRWKVEGGRSKVILLLVLVVFHLPPSTFHLSVHAEIVEGIVAVVNNEVITRHDLEEYLAPLYFQYQSEYQGDQLQQKLKELERDGLRQIIEEKLLLSEAKKRKITVDPKEVDARIEGVRARFNSQEEFDSALSEQNLTEGHLRDRYRDQLMIQKLVDEEVRYRISVSPLEITDYYNAHLEEFNVAERVKLRNILIKAQSEEEEEEAFIRIHELAVMLEHGKSFEELVKKYSEGQNAQDGGSMVVAKGELAPELDSTVFSIEAGKVSRVVKSSLGYHLFKVEEKIPAQVKPLEEAQEQIREKLYREKTKMRYQSLIGELRAKAYISIK